MTIYYFARSFICLSGDNGRVCRDVLQQVRRDLCVSEISPPCHKWLDPQRGDQCVIIHQRKDSHWISGQ